MPYFILPLDFRQRSDLMKDLTFIDLGQILDHKCQYNNIRYCLSNRNIEIKQE